MITDKTLCTADNGSSKFILMMDYSDDAFHTFMDLDSAIYYAVNGTVTTQQAIFRLIDV